MLARSHAQRAPGRGRPRPEPRETGGGREHHERSRPSVGFDWSNFAYDFPNTDVRVTAFGYIGLNQWGRFRLEANASLRREVFSDFYLGVQGLRELRQRTRHRGRAEERLGREPHPRLLVLMPGPRGARAGSAAGRSFHRAKLAIGGAAWTSPASTTASRGSSRSAASPTPWWAPWDCTPTGTAAPPSIWTSSRCPQPRPRSWRRHRAGRRRPSRRPRAGGSKRAPGG